MMTGGGTWGLQPQNGILGAGGNGVDQYPMYGQSTSALPFNPPNAPSNFTQHTPPEAVQYSAPVQAPVAPPAPTPNPVPFPAPDPTARVVVAVTPSPKKDKVFETTTGNRQTHIAPDFLPNILSHIGEAPTSVGERFSCTCR
tara:strand:- start:461 stop:886 length:426 start_codon:yes stop_codon:yes gene_type:complete